MGNEKIVREDELDFDGENGDESLNHVRPSDSVMPRARPIPAANSYEKSPIQNSHPVIHNPKIPVSENPRKPVVSQQYLADQYEQAREQNLVQPVLPAPRMVQMPVQQPLPPQKPPLILSPQHCSMVIPISSRPYND